MTIRQYLIRRANRTQVATIAFLLAVGILMSPGPRIYALRIALGVVIAAVIAAAFWSLFEIPCPSCRKPMGRIGFWVANARMLSTSPNCPHCGISVDAQLPLPPKN